MNTKIQDQTKEAGLTAKRAKTNTSRRMRARAAIVCAIAPIAGLWSSARAGVQLSGVASGSASVSQSGSITNIHTSNNAILNFSQFNIPLGSTVDIIQPNAASRELNRINSAAPSMINGSLLSNGTVYLVNPAGVIFGGGATVDVNRIYVAGSHMSDSDFLNGNDHFTGISGIVSNAGQIHANGVFMIGSQVINTGSIVAPGGMVAMLSGSDVVVSVPGSHVVATVVPAPLANSSSSAPIDLRNSPMAAGDAYSLAIRHTGYVQAKNVLINGGNGAVQVSGTINASNLTTGSTGGSVQITGGQVALTGATITADGPAGGGVVQIGGGPHESDSLSDAAYVTLDANTTVNADATTNGNGGSIVLWSSNTTNDSAILTAMGGPLGGNGGTIETSADILHVMRAPNESAPNGSPGTWLLDPLDVEIILGADNGTVSLTGNATVTNTTIINGLALGNITVTTNQAGGNTGILVQDADAPIDITTPLTAATTLTLQGNATIDLKGGINDTSGSALSVEIDALGNAGTTVTLETTGININGALTILGGTVNTTTSLAASAITIASGTTTVGTPQAVTTGSITINAPITTTAGAFTAGGTSFTTTFTGTAGPNGSITTTGGGVLLTPTGAVSIGAAVITNGGSFVAGNSTTSFTSSANGTITTTGGTGEIDISPSGAISISGAISSGTKGIFLDFGNSGLPAAQPTGAISISAPITTAAGGVFDAGGTSFTTVFTATAGPNGSITTAGGNVSLSPTGAVMLSAAVATSGGNFAAGGATEFLTNQGGSITTGTGSVNVTNTGEDNIGEPISSTGVSMTGGTQIVTGVSGTISSGTGNLTLTTGATGIDITAALSATSGTVALTATGGPITVGGTITTTGGPISLNATGSGGITTSAEINTGGGNLIVTGQSFTDGGIITDANSTTPSHTLSIITTSGTGSILLNDSISWGGATSPILIEGNGTIVLAATATITNNSTAGIAMYTEAASNTSVSIDGIINTAGPFTWAGGTFNLNTQTTSPAPTTLTALSITLGTATVIPGGAVALTSGALFLTGPMVTTGGAFVAGGTVEYLENSNASLTTNGGSVTVTNVGQQILGEPVNTSTSSAGVVGGAISFTGGTSFQTGSAGTITSGGGNVTISTPTSTNNVGDQISATLNTDGGSFSITSPGGFTDEGLITDGGIVLSGANAGNSCSIVATGTGGAITGVTVTWAGGTGRSVSINGGDAVTVNNITSTGAAPLSVSINAVGAGTLSGPITITGPLTIFTSTFTTSGSSTITSGGGAVNITSNGAVSIGAAVNTDGGSFSASSQTTLDLASGGSVTSAGGNVSLSGLTSVGVDDVVSTGGGNFTALGGTFENSAEISDGGVNDSKPQGLSITTSAGDITIGGAISWASSLSPMTFTVPTGSSVELGAAITANAAEPINFSSAPIALTTTTASITGGDVTLGAVTDGTSSQNPELTIQASGSVSLQTVGTTADPIGGISIQANGSSAAPTTTLNGDINVSGNAIFAGPVVVPTNISVTSAGTNSSDFGDLEFDGTIDGPGGLNLKTSEQLRINGNVGATTPLAFLQVDTEVNGIMFFNAGPAGTTGIALPGVTQQKSLLTVNIASGGNLEINDVTPSQRNPEGLFATIDSYGPLNINIGTSTANSSNTFVDGENEKFSVYGALNIQAVGGTIQTSDISTLGNLTLNASNIVFVMRPGAVSNGQAVDTGMDLIAGGAMSLPAGAVYSTIGSGSMDVPGFIAQSFGGTSNIAHISNGLKTTFSIIGGIEAAALFGNENLLLDLTPSTLSVSIPTFVPPIPFVFDYPIAGAFPRELVTAGNVPVDFKLAFPPVIAGPDMGQELQQGGIYSRDPSPDEIVGIVSTMAVFNDLPDTPRPKASDYRTVVNRLDPKRVQAYVDQYQAVFGASPGAKKSQMAGDFQSAWDLYVTENGNNPVSGAGFAKFCQTAPVAAAAQADLQSLHDLRLQLGGMGLSYKEAQVAFQYNILSGMSANGMREGDLASAVAATGEAH